MQNFTLSFLISLMGLSGFAQFAPPAGQLGTTAIAGDSSVFVAWATGCTVERGYQDISNPGLGFASLGDSSMALGIAGASGVVSLGDGGSAILTFENPISNGPGWDFAVFENAFDDTFLELAFVEVSSDGVNYYRFPATSYTQDTVQIESFGSVDASKIDNLAGKYRALFGTPFDLQELSGQSGLDVMHITHVKIIDVVGCIQNEYASYDQYGNKINDPWNTPFASGGFDLDAVGVIHQAGAGFQNFPAVISSINIFPNPVTQHTVLAYYLNEPSVVQIAVFDVAGKELCIVSEGHQSCGKQSFALKNFHLKSGIYLLTLQTTDTKITKKIIVNN
ncbi:MAG TPA: T9SS type A sorting domain-containing protein [Bacteroidales bacterium]|nr:T9SS type A sorting domain-containing protein [Bacteroidales bacterium]